MMPGNDAVIIPCAAARPAVTRGLPGPPIRLQVDARDDDSRESGEAPSIVMGILGKMKMDGCPELGASAECSERARQLDYDNRDR